MQSKTGRKQSGRRRADRPNPIDIHVGSRLRLRRKMMGMSQAKLAEAIWLTFQQVQKYERGADRIGASRLYELSQLLDVPVSFFFDDVDPVRAPAVQEMTAGLDPLLASAETRELVAAFHAIANENLQRQLVKFAKELAVKR